MSNSRTYKEKRRELDEKESLILAGMNSKGAKTQKVLLWSLGAGLIGLVCWGLFRSMSPEKTKKSKKKRPNKIPKNYPAIDSFLEQTAPRLGRWILKEFKD